MTKSSCLTIACAIALSLVMPATSVHAAETWLACKGTLTRSSYAIDDPASGTTEESGRVLIVDDATRSVYERGSGSRKLNVINIKKFSPERIVWGSFGRLTGDVEWDAVLDRLNMRLEMTATYRDSTQLTWEEKCRPTMPGDSEPAYVAGTNLTREKPKGSA